MSLNNVQVEKAFHHKHLGILLDEKFDSMQDIDTAILKIKKGISCNKKLRHILLLKFTIYKDFLRSLIDYGDIIFDQPQNESFFEKLESVLHKPRYQ